MNNILTIDVEELFHAEYARDLGVHFFRTPSNLPTILKLLREHNAKATFFIVGELAEKFPSVVSARHSYRDGVVQRWLIPSDPL
jgi:hypothetical protein